MKTIILTDEQHAVLQAALNYATEQRFYEASQTTDGLDRVEIEACAHEWAKLQDLLRNYILYSFPTTSLIIVYLFHELQTRWNLFEILFYTISFCYIVCIKGFIDWCTRCYHWPYLVV